MKFNGIVKNSVYRRTYLTDENTIYANHFYHLRNHAIDFGIWMVYHQNVLTHHPVPRLQLCCYCYYHRNHVVRDLILSSHFSVRIIVQLIIYVPHINLSNYHQNNILNEFPIIILINHKNTKLKLIVGISHTHDVQLNVTLRCSMQPCPLPHLSKHN